MLKNSKGTMLFEVMIAVLVLALGITGSIRSLSNVVQVTKRSRDLFEAQFVVSDLYFDLWAFPDEFDTLTDVSGVSQFGAEGIELSKDYMYSFQVEELMPAAEELDEEDEPVTHRGVSQEYRKLVCTINDPSGTLHVLNTFHAVSTEEGE